MIEEWRDIANFEGLYLISNLGHVKSVERYKRNNAGNQFVNERLRVCIRLQRRSLRWKILVMRICSMNQKMDILAGMLFLVLLMN